MERWLLRYADGSETGISDCDEVKCISEDEKAKILWVDRMGHSHTLSVSSLKKTYFKKVKETWGK